MRAALLLAIACAPIVVLGAVDSDIPGDAACFQGGQRSCKQGTPGVISFMGDSGSSTIPPGSSSGAVDNPWQIGSATSGTDLVVVFTLKATGADDLINGPLGGSFPNSPYVGGRWISESIQNTSASTWTSFQIGLSSIPHLSLTDTSGLSFGRLKNATTGKADPNNYYGQASVKSDLFPTVAFDPNFDLITFSGGKVQPNQTVTFKFFIGDNLANSTTGSAKNSNPLYLIERPLTEAIPHKAGIIRNGMWILDANGNQLLDATPTDSIFFWGQFGDTMVLGDWSGTAKTKAGIVRLDGIWVLDYNGNGLFDGPVADRAFAWGQIGDTAIVGDWNGSGTTKIGVVRPGAFGLQWILDYNGNGVWDGPTEDRAWFFGQNTDKPLIGDWSGTGTTKIGLLRPGALGLQWILDFNGNGQWDGPGVDRAWFFGGNNDSYVLGDWSGNGTTKIGLLRPGPLGLQWILDFNGNGQWDGPAADRAWFFGQNTDRAVLGDWSGSGTAKIGVYRGGQWVIDYNGNGAWDGAQVDRAFFWGQPADIPIVGRW